VAALLDLNPGAPSAGVDIRVSFEFFPPKTEKMQEQLWASIERLAPLKPHFVSVTYGAGGSTRERTHDTVVRIQNEKRLAAAAHLTCVGATCGEIDEIARRYWDAGIRHIVALRGDPPEGQTTYSPYPGGYAFASDLVRGLKRVADFEVSVAAYPEIHPEASDPDADLENLKRKVGEGASRAITQSFFDPEVFLRFRDRAAGLRVPLVPGLLPVTNFAQTLKFCTKVGTSIPPWMHRLFEGLDEDADTRKLIAAAVAAEQVRTLVKEGVTDFHFYTLNRADLTFAICHILGVRAGA
jgi:methylenetetrahydrofolate reductase (NADPH)